MLTANATNCVNCSPIAQIGDPNNIVDYMYMYMYNISTLTTQRWLCFNKTAYIKGDVRFPNVIIVRQRHLYSAGYASGGGRDCVAVGGAGRTPGGNPCSRSS